MAFYVNMGESGGQELLASSLAGPQQSRAALPPFLYLGGGPALLRQSPPSLPGLHLSYISHNVVVTVGLAGVFLGVGSGGKLSSTLLLLSGRVKTQKGEKIKRSE